MNNKNAHNALLDLQIYYQGAIDENLAAIADIEKKTKLYKLQLFHVNELLLGIWKETHEQPNLLVLDLSEKPADEEVVEAQTKEVAPELEPEEAAAEAQENLFARRTESTGRGGRRGNSKPSRRSKPIPLQKEFRGMSTLWAAAQVIQSYSGEILSRDEIAHKIFTGNGQRNWADLNNLLSKELSRGIKEQRFFRLTRNGSSYYTWDLSKVEKASLSA